MLKRDFPSHSSISYSPKSFLLPHHYLTSCAKTGTKGPGKEEEGGDWRAPAKAKGREYLWLYADTIEATQDVEGLTYRPRTAETREVYQHILSAVHASLGDQAQDIVRSAADTVLETLKNENMKDFDKKKEIDHRRWCRGRCHGRPGIEKKDTEIDEEHGVAVVFDEEEQEEENEGQRRV